MVGIPNPAERKKSFDNVFYQIIFLFCLVNSAVFLSSSFKMFP